MTFRKTWNLNISVFCLATLLCMPVCTFANGIQEAWDNPTANMTAGSTKPGYAQLSWSPGSVLPIKLRNGMVTMVTLPNGEQIADAVVEAKGGQTTVAYGVQPEEVVSMVDALNTFDKQEESRLIKDKKIEDARAAKRSSGRKPAPKKVAPKAKPAPAF